MKVFAASKWLLINIDDKFMLSNWLYSSFGLFLKSDKNLELLSEYNVARCYPIFELEFSFINWSMRARFENMLLQFQVDVALFKLNFFLQKNSSEFTIGLVQSDQIFYDWHMRSF